MNLLNFTETSGHESLLAIPPVTSWWSHSEVRDLAEETEIWSYFPMAKKHGFSPCFPGFYRCSIFPGGRWSENRRWAWCPQDPEVSHWMLPPVIHWIIGFSWDFPWINQLLGCTIHGKLHAKLGPCEMPQIDWNYKLQIVPSLFLSSIFPTDMRYFQTCSQSMNTYTKCIHIYIYT